MNVTRAWVKSGSCGPDLTIIRVVDDEKNPLKCHESTGAVFLT